MSSEKQKIIIADRYTILEEVNNLTRNEIAIIQTIKENRIKWSEVITNIENVTRTVDLYYDQGFFEEIGGISYSSYDFDTVNNRVLCEVEYCQLAYYLKDSYEDEFRAKVGDSVE